MTYATLCLTLYVAVQVLGSQACTRSRTEIFQWLRCAASAEILVDNPIEAPGWPRGSLKANRKVGASHPISLGSPKAPIFLGFS